MAKISQTVFTWDKYSGKMGRLTKRSVLGAVSGKVGQVVFVDVGYGTNVRGLPGLSSKNKKGSPKQQVQRSLFIMPSRFFRKALNPIFQMGYQAKDKKDVAGTQAAIAYHLLNAVTGEYPNHTLELSKLKFSRSFRSTENASALFFSAPADGGLRVDWALDAFPHTDTRLDDLAVIILHEKNGKRWIATHNDQRRALHKQFNLKPFLKPSEWHAWVFFASADGKRVSETQYLGMLTAQDIA